VGTVAGITLGAAGGRARRAAAADRWEEEPTPTGVLYAKFRVVITNIRIVIINRDSN
jgi:hypothetical protein